MTARVREPDTEPEAEAEPETEPETEPDVETEADADAPAGNEAAVDDERAGRRRFGWLRGGRRPVVALLVVAVLLAGAGGWVLVQAAKLRDSPSAGNIALVDPAATAEVSSAVSAALNRIFSYSYDRTADTERAADELLRGSARESYDRLFAEVRELAPEQKLVLTTRVVSTAVQELSGDRARLLVFLDQSATRADANTSDAAAAQLSVVARRDGDTWVITGLEPR